LLVNQIITVASEIHADLKPGKFYSVSPR